MSDNPNGDRHTTVVVEKRNGDGVGAGTVIAVVIGLALVALIAWFLVNQNRQDAVRTDAISGAADSVAGAADNVGDAVNDVTKR